MHIAFSLFLSPFLSFSISWWWLLFYLTSYSLWLPTVTLVRFLHFLCLSSLVVIISFLRRTDKWINSLAAYAMCFFNFKRQLQMGIHSLTHCSFYLLLQLSFSLSFCRNLFVNGAFHSQICKLEKLLVLVQRETFISKYRENDRL